MAGPLEGAPVAKRYRAGHKVSPFYDELLASLGPETELNQRIYLVPFSRVLPTVGTDHPYRDLSLLSRQDVALMVKDGG